MRSEKTSSGLGFSRNSSTLPSAPTRTMPYSLGRSTWVRETVTAAPERRCSEICAPTSRSAKVSPLAATKTGSRLPSRAFMEPPVPSGASSSEYVMSTPMSEPSPTASLSTSDL